MRMRLIRIDSETAKAATRKCKMGLLTSMAVVLLVTAMASASAADQIVSLYVRGKQVKCNPAARVHAGITYAPLRAAAQAVGAHVSWNAHDQMATICTNNRCVPVKANQGIMIHNSLLIPVRLMSEALGRDVTWDPAAKAVRIGPAHKTP